MILAMVQSSAVLLLTMCSAALLRRQSAAIRHLILTAGLVCSLVVPLLARVLPIQFAPAREIHGFVQDQAQALWQRESDVAPATEMPARALGPKYAFLAVWLGGVAIAGLVLIIGVTRLTFLAIRSKPAVDPRWTSASHEVVRRLRLKRRVQLFRNERAVLGTWGFLRPRIFLPHDADEWPDERIHVVLTHEFAHIKRFDWPVQMLAEIARAVYWFNPLFWAACRRLRSESEHACDDVVLNAGFDAKDYAAHLLDLARTLTRSERTWSSPVLAMSRPPNLERRFVAMLNPSVNRRVINRATLLATCAIAVSVTLSLASVRAPEQTLQPTASPAPAVRASALTPTPAVPITPSPVSMKPAAARPVRRQGLADGSLAGIVLDPTGAVVPGVIVIVRSDKIATETVTGPVGQYEFRALPPGVYTLTAQLPGFVTAGIGRLEIQSSQTLKQNVMLSVGTVAQRVAVSAVGQPKPAPLPGTPQRVRIGGNVRAANLISMVRPDYPPAARDSGIEGTVHLQGIIGIDGALAGLRVISITDPELAAAAIESVRQWRYRPALLNGTPVEVITEIDVDFRLTQ